MKENIVKDVTPAVILPDDDNAWYKKGDPGKRPYEDTPAIILPDDDNAWYKQCSK
ncbi:MAG: hypothetical protein L0Y61_01765 [Epsilonproteobacteria bacterium]|nr:hypothetical protein [Campylobacterota bacterium]